ASEALGDSSWLDALFLSTDNSPGSGVFVSYGYETGPVASGGSYWRTNSVRLPAVQSGTYYLIFKIDSGSSLYESNTNNNSISVPINLTITPSDLVPVAFQAPTLIDGPPFPTVTLVWGATNQGTGAALDSWFDDVYIST